MSKFLLNLLQISKALLNSKIQFLIQKSFFFTFGPADLAAHSAFGPAGPRWPLSSPAGRSPQAGPCRSARARRWRICKNTFSSLISDFCHRHLLSLPSLTRGPHMSESSSPPRRPTPAVSPPCHRFPRRPLRASGYR
jgi:hypothetical protein